METNEADIIMKAGIIPILNKNVWRTNRKCCHLFLSTTVVFLLIVVSLGCYYAASRNSNQQGDFKDFEIANVTALPVFGNFIFSCFKSCKCKCV